MRKRRWLREQIPALEAKKDLKLEAPPNHDPVRSAETFRIRFDERPNYPRYNSKNPEK
jgi:hypothetical protein